MYPKLMKFEKTDDGEYWRAPQKLSDDTTVLGVTWSTLREARAENKEKWFFQFIKTLDLPENKDAKKLMNQLIAA